MSYPFTYLTTLFGLNAKYTLYQETNEHNGVVELSLGLFESKNIASYIYTGSTLSISVIVIYIIWTLDFKMEKDGKTWMFVFIAITVLIGAFTFSRVSTAINWQLNADAFKELESPKHSIHYSFIMAK